MGKQKLPEAVMDMEAVPIVNRKQSVEKTKTRVFDKVPNEILEMILVNLPLEAKKNARLVSSRWKAVLNYPIRFSIPLTKLTLPDFEAFDYKLNELKVVLNQLNIPDKFSPRMKRSFQTAKTVHFKADDYVEWNEEGRGEGVIDGKGIEHILKSCQRIQTLKFDFSFMYVYRLTSPMDLRKISFKFLKTLQVRLAFVGSTSVQLVLLRLKMPCLRTLDVERLDERNIFRPVKFLYPVLLECLVRNRHTLRELKLVRLLTTLMPTDIPIEVFNQLAQMNLESLEIHHWNMTQWWQAWDPANQLLNNLRSLKVLKLHTDCGTLMELASNLLLNNGHSLTTLELNVEHAAANFNPDLLTGLTALTDFSFTCNEFMFGFIPLGLEILTWNAPLSNDWYLPEIRDQFPNLIRITLGPLALQDVHLHLLCDVLFGPEDQKTRLKSFTLQHKPIGENDLILSSAQQLPAAIYQIEHDENIRIILK